MSPRPSAAPTGRPDTATRPVRVRQSAAGRSAAGGSATGRSATDGSATDGSAIGGPDAGEPAAEADVGTIPELLAGRARAAAIWTGFGAAAVGLFAAVVVALAMWVPDAAATGTSGSTVRGGLLAFLAAQHAGLRIDGVAIGFVPLGLTMFAVCLCRRSARALWSLPCVADDLSHRRVVELTAWQVAGYAVTTTAVSFYAVVGRSSASPVAVAVGSVGVGLAGFAPVAAALTPIGAELWWRVAPPVRAATRAGVAAAATFVAGGVVLVGGSTLLHAGRFLDLARGMGHGLSGLPVAVGDTLAVPNAALAGTAYLAGPGFAIGDHATYAPFGGHGGLVPAFPVLAGLPADEHATLTVLALMLLTVIGAGLAAGLSIRRDLASARWTTALASAAGSGLGAGIVLAALTALAGGPLGAHQLRAVGASPWQVGLAVLVEVSCVSTITVATTRLFARSGVQGDDALPASTVPPSTVPASTVPAATVALAVVAEPVPVFVAGPAGPAGPATDAALDQREANAS